MGAASRRAGPGPDLRPSAGQHLPRQCPSPGGWWVALLPGRILLHRGHVPGGCGFSHVATCCPPEVPPKEKGAW